jgi:hypothetical protein
MDVKYLCNIYKGKCGPLSKSTYVLCTQDAIAFATFTLPEHRQNTRRNLISPNKNSKIPMLVFKYLTNAKKRNGF